MASGSLSHTFASSTTSVSVPPVSTGSQVQVLHRIAEVRAQQGISLRTVSRRTGVEVRQLRQQEASDSDVRLSDLYRWQEALEVPVADLLSENTMGLSSPIQQRAQLVRIMKTVVALLEASQQPKIHRMATMLREQLIQLMPELESIVGWPAVGSRRPAEDVGRIGSHPIDLHSLAMEMEDNG